jgi:pimeloyl-ACP methyl ester carboxylesterase
MEGYTEIQGRQIWFRLLNFAEDGRDKPLLVFLHEGLGCSDQWRDFPETISEVCGLPALLYDRYGYGRSEIKESPNTSWYMHNEALLFLPDLLEHLGIYRKVILVGHSDGGTIALLFAARFPEKTLAVITECDHVVCEEITVKGVRDVVHAYELGNLKPLLQSWHGDKTDTLFYGWTTLWLSEKGAAWSITDELPKIKAPLLAIQGTLDNYGSTEQLLLKLKLVAGSVQINLLDGCGHVPHHERAEEVALLITGFINRYV